MVERKGGLLTDDDALVEKDGILEEAKEVKTQKQKKKEQKDS
jgi:hypothetical protein